MPEAIAHVMRDQLLPMADIATPNPVELLVDRILPRLWRAIQFSSVEPARAKYGLLTNTGDALKSRDGIIRNVPKKPS
ncbi:hypothetical protein [Sinorhizobium medicae]|uniref:hypothetical protein n=1 Tax=Sinorhizobium medicae TaxID=110321 RepID=UPI001F343377|nr:hypothetical protein [Sinorhizobium medicae]